MMVSLYHLVSTVMTGVHTHSVHYNTWLKVGVPLSVWCWFAWLSNREEMLRPLDSFHVVPDSSPSCCRRLKNAPWASHFGLSLSLSLSVCVPVFVPVPFFQGASAKLRKATISFVMPRLLLDGFVWNLIFVYFTKICRGYVSFIGVRQEQRGLYMGPYAHLWSYLAQFFLEWEVFRTKVVEEIKTHILCS